jgi:ribosomal subunit interface protein
MNLQIEWPHIEPGEKTFALVESSFHHLDKMHNRINHCDVVLRKEKNGQQTLCAIDATMDVHGYILFAGEKEETFEKALKQLIEDLEHQMLKHKENEIGGLCH